MQKIGSDVRVRESEKKDPPARSVSANSRYESSRPVRYSNESSIHSMHSMDWWRALEESYLSGSTRTESLSSTKRNYGQTKFRQEVVGGIPVFVKTIASLGIRI